MLDMIIKADDGSYYRATTQVGADCAAHCDAHALCQGDDASEEWEAVCYKMDECREDRGASLPKDGSIVFKKVDSLWVDLAKVKEADDG